MTESTRKWTEELQEAVELRAKQAQGSPQTPMLIKGRYEVSAEVVEYLQKMQDYRAKAQAVRLLQY